MRKIVVNYAVFCASVFLAMSKPALSICLLSSAHEPLDERLYHHFAKTFAQAGHRVTILCATEFLQKEENGIVWDSFEGNFMRPSAKIRIFRQKLTFHKPDIVLSQEPLPTLAGYLYKTNAGKKVKLIYDITEWHPSQTQLRKYPNFLKRCWQGLVLACFNLFSAMLANAFVYGEMAKRFPYRFLFPFKKSTVVGYYPENELFVQNMFVPKSESDEWVLGYTGIVNEERGMFRFLEAVHFFSKTHPSVRLRLLMVVWFEKEAFKTQFETKLAALKNVKVTLYPKLPLLEFCEKIGEMDICFDLRKANWENNNSLPIKIFYYMASGKPVIYTRLKAIVNEVPQISEFGHLVDASNSQEVSEAIAKYVFQPQVYKRHCEQAKSFYNSRYNWKLISPNLLRFVEKLYHD